MHIQSGTVYDFRDPRWGLRTLVCKESYWILKPRAVLSVKKKKKKFALVFSNKGVTSLRDLTDEQNFQLYLLFPNLNGYMELCNKVTLLNRTNPEITRERMSPVSFLCLSLSTGFHATQADFKLSMEQRMTLNSSFTRSARSSGTDQEI